MLNDPITTHLSRIARLLELAGYAIEVDDTAATITVWLSEWPVLIHLRSAPDDS